MGEWRTSSSTAIQCLWRKQTWSPITTPHSLVNHQRLKNSFKTLSRQPSLLTTSRGASLVKQTANRVFSKTRAQNWQTTRDAKIGRPREANTSNIWTTSRPMAKTFLNARLEKSQTYFELKSSPQALTKNRPNDFLHLIFAKVSGQWPLISLCGQRSTKGNSTEITKFE